MRFSLDGRILTVQLLRKGATRPSKRSAARRSARPAARTSPRGCSAARDHAHPALAGRPDEPELPLPARRLELVPARRPVRQLRRVRELPRRVAGAEGADRRDRQQVGAAVRLQLSDLHRLHGPDRLQAAEGGPRRIGERTSVARRSRNRDQRRPSGRHALERRDRPAATYRDERVADRHDRLARGRRFRCRRTASTARGRLTSAWDDTAQRAE